MASIVKRNNSYCVVYTYKHADGTQKQKWETFTDLADAKNRKKEVEYKESVGTFVAPQCRTLKRPAYRIRCPVRKNQMGTLNLPIKQCSDLKLHNTAYRLNEAARSHHPRN